jgi:hypothetical protein
MILVCPSCGAAASLEAWANDRDWRELIALIPTIPAPLQTRAISYLGLFRTGKTALKPAKALNILGELRDLIGAGTIHWDRGETRPAPVGLWEQALDAVIERRPGALKNHNYLKHTAWEMAAGLAAEAEKTSHRRGAEHAERMPEEERQAPRRRGCFTCEAFRPPRGCQVRERPVSGNQMLGCSKWKEKAAASSVGELMGSLVTGLSHHEDHEGDTKGHGENFPRQKDQ